MNPFRGILLTWSLGAGAGKTTLLKEWAYDPKKVLWINGDNKPISFNRNILGAYHNLHTETKGMKRFEIGHWFLNLLDKSTQFNAIVIDTYFYLGECICAMVHKNPTEYRENYSNKSDYRWLQIPGEGHIWHGKVLSRMAEQFDFVGLSTHSREKYDEIGEPTGLNEPKAQNELTIAASDIWLLTRGDGAYCPTALVSKQGATDIETKKGRRTFTILPEKLSPQKGDMSLWDVYERYYNNPISARQEPLQDYEIPDAIESSYIKGIMTPDQKRLYDLRLEIKQNQIKEQEILFNNQWAEAQTFAKQLVSSHNGMPPSFVVDEIWSEFENKYPQFTKVDLEKML